MAPHWLTVIVLAGSYLLAGLGSVANAQLKTCDQYDAEVAAGKTPRRVALSIGNNDARAGVNNAANDSRLIATTLQELGWDVTQASNLTRGAMIAVLNGFRAKVEPLCNSDIVLFYFAGNGFEVNRVSYLGGTDSENERVQKPKSLEDQLAAITTFVNTKEVLDAFELHQGAKFIVLDTCRDNPLANSPSSLQQLASVRLPDNTFFAYASEPLDNAADFGPDDKNHGPFAWSLSKKLREIQASAQVIFREVRKEVIELSARPGAAFLQRPFVESSLSREVYLGIPPKPRELVSLPTPEPPKPATGTKVEKRIALLVANADYANQNSLKNPANDIQHVSDVLKRLGFEVFVQSNLVARDFAEALRTFGMKAHDADWALIYFAGHGMEIGGRTYVLPTDVKLEKDIHADDEAIRLEQILEKVERAQGLGLVVLDACRNNPFERSMKVTGRRGRETRTGSGLARADVDTVGVLVAYSARHGTTADDGETNLSPFAEALVEEIQKPGVEVNMVFRRVRDRVLHVTQKRQEPFIYGSLPGREFYFDK